MSLVSDLAVIRALTGRALNEITRVPAGAVPGVLAPTIFLVGLSAVFGQADRLPGFDAPNFRSWILAVGLMQGAGFSGAATGVNLARDIEHGWFDRLLLAPRSRVTLLVGIVLSASIRSLMPASVLVAVGLALDVPWPGVPALLVAAVLFAGFAAAVACYAMLLALRFRSQQAAPLMQAGAFVAVLFTTAYAPRELLADWLRPVADVNPVTHVLEGVRQGFVGDVTWATTWPAVLSLTGLVLVLGTLALRALLRVGD